MSRTSAISVSSNDEDEDVEGDGKTVVNVGTRTGVGEKFMDDCRLVWPVEADSGSSLETEFCLFRHFTWVEEDVYIVDMTVVVMKVVVGVIMVVVVVMVIGSGRLIGD